MTPYGLTVAPQAAWCVYTHALDGQVFYVGKGRADRPFSPHGRSQRWATYVATLPQYTITIVSWHATETAARQEERRLIHALAPPCNVALLAGRREARRPAAKKVVCSVILPEALLAIVQEAAAREERTVSAQIRLVVAEWARRQKAITPSSCAASVAPQSSRAVCGPGC